MCGRSPYRDRQHSDGWLRIDFPVNTAGVPLTYGDIELLESVSWLLLAICGRSGVPSARARRTLVAECCGALTDRGKKHSGCPFCEHSHGFRFPARFPRLKGVQMKIVLLTIILAATSWGQSPPDAKGQAKKTEKSD